MVAQEIARIAALVALIIVIAAIGVAVLVLAGLAINWLAGVAEIALAWLDTNAQARNIISGLLVACAITGVVVTLRHER